jgi:hypothetical protein
MTFKIIKKLSRNDIGDTGGHQAGILVPKENHILEFFPKLDSSQKNPRTTIIVREKSDNTRWEFNYIYYNNKFFDGTRNEYRLTCMTKFFRSIGAKFEDELIFEKDENASFIIDLKRKNEVAETDSGVLVLKGGWKIINI